MQPAYYNLGVVYSEMMQYDLALSCYEKAAVQRPMYAEAYCNMGVIYKNRGDLETAIACYERCSICSMHLSPLSLPHPPHQHTQTRMCTHARARAHTDSLTQL